MFYSSKLSYFLIEQYALSHIILAHFGLRDRLCELSVLLNLTLLQSIFIYKRDFLL